MIKTIESAKHGNIRIIYQDGMDFATISWYSKKGLEIVRVPVEIFIAVDDAAKQEEDMEE